jgi:WD40 repeat protein
MRATANADNTVKLSYLKGILPTFTGNSVSISPNGEIAIANGNIVSLRGNYGLINRRGAESAEARGVEELSVVVQGKEEYEVIKVIFSPTGKYFATIDSENQIKVWNLQGKLLQKWRGHDVDNTNNNLGFDAIQDMYKKSPYQLMREGQDALRKADKKTALLTTKPLPCPLPSLTVTTPGLAF